VLAILIPTPDAHAVGTEPDRIHRQSKRLERAVAVQGADAFEACPRSGLPIAEYSGCLWSHAICAGVDCSRNGFWVKAPCSHRRRFARRDSCWAG
jgi:hypothetical protein